jgi:hypothetical protein
MLGDALSLHDALASSRRLPLRASDAKPAAWELAALVGLGALTAAIVSYVKLKAGIPGHAIIRSVLPIAFGVALVPRRFAGSIMSASAGLTMIATGHAGFGSLASMISVGVLLDFALRKARAGLGLYAAFVLAGLGGNAVGWGVRAAARLAEGDATSGAWWARSVLSYSLCGIFAGLLSAALWFQLSKRDETHA